MKNKEEDDEQGVPDRLFVAQRLKMMFKKSSDETISDRLFKIIEIPLNFLRDYSIPMAEEGEWSRFRAAVLPLTIPCFILILNGNIDIDLT